MRYLFIFLLFAIGLYDQRVTASEISENELQYNVLIREVNLVDIANDRIIANQDVFIDGDLIVKIVSANPTNYADVRPLTKVVDGRNKYLMPGLIDMHVHVFQPADLSQLLRHGVTTARVMYGWPQTLSYREKVANGEMFGPDLFVSSPVINQKSPYASSSIHKFVDTPAEAIKLVEQYAKQGFDLIKTYDGIQPNIFEAISKAANRHGMQTAGHPSFYLSKEQYLKSSPQTIEHIEMLYQAWLDYSSDEKKLIDLSKYLAKKQIPVTTTLVVFDNLARIAVEKQAFIDGEPVEYIHPFIKRLERSSVDFITKVDKPEQWRKKADYLGYMAKVLNEHDVPLVIGSDGGVGYTINGKSTIDEIALLHRYGMPVNDILRAATITPAMALNKQSEIGQIAIGYKANLLLLEQDPNKNIMILRKPHTIFKAGRVFDADKLSELDNIAKQHMDALDVGVHLLRAM
ncbi:MAG: amidohydrolase family protein [Kangiellaceae bacterium]|jgi:imidazolonepropionase-like amidohydrolase|nr:amidohydrolase family protein [Kangiellaceae bacterium]